MNKYTYGLCIILFFSSLIFPQRLLKITTQINGQTEHISYVTRNGMTFTSASDLGKILSGNYFLNSKSAKIEIKFQKYSVTFSARNKFVVVKQRSGNSKQTYQISAYPLLIQNDVFIPVDFCLQYLGMASGNSYAYDNNLKNLSIDKTKKVAVIPDIKPPVIPEKKPGSKTVSTNTNSKFNIYGIEIDEKVNGTLIRLKSNKQIFKYGSTIKNNTLYLFLNDADVDPEIVKKIKKTGIVKSIISKKVKSSYQLEFNLTSNFSSHETFQDPSGNDLLISIHNDMFSSESYNPEKDKEKWKFDVVVIDAGHGGKDAGAIGVAGTREKEINLKLALKLGELIKKNLPEVKVIYTREKDNFVELYKRGKIANENNGKLFISIHCNSLKKKPSKVSGFEVYLLRPGRTEEAIDIAEFENSVINYEDNPDRYQKLDDENFILVSMAHSSYMRHSEEFSDLLNKQLANIKQLPSRGIKQAGFYVLVGASMPGILFEAGFLSNRQDEKYLKSNSGQNAIAKKMFEAVKQYKVYYDKIIEEGT